MTNVKLTILNLGFATFVASLNPLPVPVALEEATAGPDLPSTISYVDVRASEPETIDGDVGTVGADVSIRSTPATTMRATEALASSGASAFLGAVHEATTAISAVSGEEVAVDCTGWERVLIWYCWWWCSRPNYFCPCITCEF